MHPFISFPVSPLKADACERGIVGLNRVKLDVKPNVDDTKSDEGFPVLSLAVSLGK